MPHRTVTIASSSGLHARPASRIARAARDSGHSIMIGRAHQTPVDAASILLILGLALRQGEEVTLSSTDPAAAAAIDVLSELLASDLDAD